MQEHEQLSHKQINEDLLKDVLTVPKWWLPAVAFFRVGRADRAVRIFLHGLPRSWRYRIEQTCNVGVFYC